MITRTALLVSAISFPEDSPCEPSSECLNKVNLTGQMPLLHSVHNTAKYSPNSSSIYIYPLRPSSTTTIPDNSFSYFPFFSRKILTFTIFLWQFVFLESSVSHHLLAKGQHWCLLMFQKATLRSMLGRDRGRDMWCRYHSWISLFS